VFKEYKIQDQRCEKELERGRTNPWKDPDIIWTKHYQQSKFFAFKLIQNNSSLICCRIKTEHNTNKIIEMNVRNACFFLFPFPFGSVKLQCKREFNWNKRKKEREKSIHFLYSSLLPFHSSFISLFRSFHAFISFSLRSTSLHYKRAKREKKGKGKRKKKEVNDESCFLFVFNCNVMEWKHELNTKKKRNRIHSLLYTSFLSSYFITNEWRIEREERSELMWEMVRFTSLFHHSISHITLHFFICFVLFLHFSLIELKWSKRRKREQKHQDLTDNRL